MSLTIRYLTVSTRRSFATTALSQLMCLASIERLALRMAEQGRTLYVGKYTMGGTTSSRGLQEQFNIWWYMTMPCFQEPVTSIQEQ
jgi:hypothetical protein